MSIVKRLTAMMASAFALAATPQEDAWKTPRPLGPGRPTPGGLQPPAPPDQAHTTTTTTVPPPPAASRSREPLVFALGFALAGVVGVWVLLTADSSPVPGNPKTGVAPPQSETLASGQLAACPKEPVAAAASEKDGQFPLQANLEGLMAADIPSFIAIGNDSATAGRPRDAEAAFLMACRVADKLGGPASVEVADAKFHLAAHYARLALGGGGAGGAGRAELLRRAEPLYRDSLQTASASYGEAHEKSQLAAKGLAAVRQALVPSTSATAAPAPAPTPTATPVPAQAQAQAQIVPLAPVSKRAARVEAAEKPPSPTAPGAGTAQGVGPLPPANIPGKNRQPPRLTQECLPAVATLGLCEPGM